MYTMTNDDIKAYYDGSNITLAELSAMTGKTVKQLKTILMGAQLMSYFKAANLNPTAAAVYRANEKREQERKERERLEHWARLRRDHPAIERNS